jgi:porin
MATVCGAMTAQSPADAPASQPSDTQSIWQSPTLTGDWFGLRPKLEDHGITFNGNLTEDYSKSLMGGTDDGGDAFRSLLNLNITLDTGKLGAWKDGTFYANFQNQNGRNGQELIGNIQGVSNIDADGQTALYEIWYQQILLDGKLRIKAGKVDATNEFAYVENSAEFLNSSMGYSPTLVGFPTFPDPATSINVFFTPMDSLTFGAGIYDGSTLHGDPTGPRGPAKFLSSVNDLFLIGEIDYSWNFSNNRPGRIGVGVWHDTGSVPKFDRTAQATATGPFFVMDQMLWRKNPGVKDDDQGLYMYAQYGWADPHISTTEDHGGVGLSDTGLFPSRNADITGIGISWVRLSDDPVAGFLHSNETVIETFYKIQATPWLSIKPDLQYIMNPAGRSRDCLAATIRLMIKF